MGQFSGLLPQFTYGPGSPQTDLEFTVPPFVQEQYQRSTTLEDSAPEADTGSTTEFVANHVYVFDFFRIQVQLINDTELEAFDAWWDVVRDGQEFTYYPDKDDLGTSHNVIVSTEDMENFEPTRRDGMWYSDVYLRKVA